MNEVTFLPIFLAGIVTTILGSIWYHPRVFGSIWMRLSNITPEMAERGKRRMPYYVVIAFLGSMLIAYIMDYFGIAWGVYDWVGAMQLGFWCWAGFIVPTFLGSVLWEQRPFRLYLLNVIYWLVAFILIALVLLY